MTGLTLGGVPMGSMPQLLQFAEQWPCQLLFNAVRLEQCHSRKSPLAPRTSQRPPLNVLTTSRRTVKQLSLSASHDCCGVVAAGTQFTARCCHGSVRVCRCLQLPSPVALHSVPPHKLQSVQHPSIHLLGVTPHHQARAHAPGIVIPSAGAPVSDGLIACLPRHVSAGMRPTCQPDLPHS